MPPVINTCDLSPSPHQHNGRLLSLLELKPILSESVSLRPLFSLLFSIMIFFSSFITARASIFVNVFLVRVLELVVSTMISSHPSVSRYDLFVGTTAYLSTVKQNSIVDFVLIPTYHLPVPPDSRAYSLSRERCRVQT